MDGIDCKAIQVSYGSFYKGMWRVYMLCWKLVHRVGSTPMVYHQEKNKPFNPSYISNWLI